MICPNCGQTIPDGLPSCPACGAPLGAAPQQPMGAPGYGAPQQPMGAPGYGAPGYGAPAGGAPIDFNGFMNRAKTNPVLWAIPASFVLTLIFSLVKAFVRGKIDVGLFKSSAGETIFANAAIFGILALLAAIWNCAVELHSGSQAGFGGVIAKYKSLPFSQFYAGGFQFLMVLIGGLVALSRVKDQLGSEFFGDAIKVNLGVSFYFMLIAAILGLLPAILRMVKHQNPYDV